MQPSHPFSSPDRTLAQALDDQDELASFRQAFVPEILDVIYLDGNSLGRLPAATLGRLEEAIAREWGGQLIHGWREAGWMDAPRRIGDKLGQLLGAAPGQVVCTDSTSVNLFKLAMAALSLRPGRTAIVSDEFNFPTDLYIFQGCIQLLGNRHKLHLARSADGVHMQEEAVCQLLDDRTALLSFSHPAFKSCFAYEVPRLTQRAHQVGALTLWDFSHGIGAVPLKLDVWGVDFAVGCSYKYANGGPGAPAWLYVRRELQDQAISPIWGWWGHQEPFAFDLDYRPAEGISRFLCGSPPVLSMAAIEPAVELLLQAGLERVRAKSLQLSSYLIYLIDTVLQPLGFWVGSPRHPERRGGHVLACHELGYSINSALVAEKQVVTDFRPPNGIRLAPIALYNSFSEVWEAVDRLRQVVEEGLYHKYPAQAQAKN
ncbi:MAG: kynureninase [Chloroflexi bacterium]|nr:kynureninase [Chloroflexota bacterium]